VTSWGDLIRYINRAQAGGDRVALATGVALQRRIESEASKAKDRLRLTHPDLDAALVQNKGLVPIRQRRR
jgi:hypothetical protein